MRQCNSALPVPVPSYDLVLKPANPERREFPGGREAALGHLPVYRAPADAGQLDCLGQPCRAARPLFAGATRGIVVVARQPRIGEGFKNVD